MRGEVGFGTIMSTLILAYAVGYITPSLTEAGQNLTGVNAAMYALIPFSLIAGTVYTVARGLGLV